MSGIPTSQSFCFSSLQLNKQTSSCSYGICSVNPSISSLSDIKLKKQLGLRFGTPTKDSNSITFKCNSTTGPGGPGSGDNESKAVLDAFFLGKAVAEAVNERIESAVGEFLSTIGRLQAEQQRQIQDFQEDVLVRAKKAKETAAREAMEAQGIVPKPTSTDAASVTYNAKSATSSPTIVAVTPTTTSSSTPNSSAVPIAQKGPDPAGEGPTFGVSDYE
ncbi:uncharacterized protein At4g13200, chloroplastic [Euphorbia lathyris]|uniref:uncharacterized protein At4g13200, chloroplastic n=1 Tax=Euphorbia lathyris TaxID=212925 RepID=UPI00331433EB